MLSALIDYDENNYTFLTGKIETLWSLRTEKYLKILNDLEVIKFWGYIKSIRKKIIVLSEKIKVSSFDSNKRFLQNVASNDFP